MSAPTPPPAGGPTRRSVLKKGLVGGALLAAGGAGWLALRGSAEVPVPEGGLAVLTPREHAVLLAVARRLVPARPGAPSVDDLRLGQVCDRILQAADGTAQQETRQLLMLFENALAGFLFGARVTPFTRLAPDAQDAVLAEWRQSRLAVRRTGWLALRTLVASAYFASPQTWPTAGYPGPLPGLHDAQAPVWKGGGAPRPPSNGRMLEEAAP